MLTIDVKILSRCQLFYILRQTVICIKCVCAFANCKYSYFVKSIWYAFIMCCNNVTLMKDFIRRLITWSLPYRSCPPEVPLLLVWYCRHLHRLGFHIFDILCRVTGRLLCSQIFISTHYSPHTNNTRQLLSSVLGIASASVDTEV